MRETEYQRCFAWESTGYKGDMVSLALLSAEIKFYDFILNDKRVIENTKLLNDKNLTDDERSDCQYYINNAQHRLNITLPMLGFSENFVEKMKNSIDLIRRILNIKVVEANEYSKY